LPRAAVGGFRTDKIVVGWVHYARGKSKSTCQLVPPSGKRVSCIVIGTFRIIGRSPSLIVPTTRTMTVLPSRSGWAGAAKSTVPGGRGRDIFHHTRRSLPCGYQADGNRRTSLIGSINRTEWRALVVRAPLTTDTARFSMTRRVASVHGPGYDRPTCRRDTWNV